MALIAVHIPNQYSSNTDVNRLLGRMVSGSGVIESAGFTVSAQTSPDMTVKVSGSTASDNLVIVTTGGDAYHGWNTANANVTISANSTGVTKKDHIVAYINTAYTSATPDTTGGLVLTSVRGTGTAAPTDGEIDTATGSKPWIRLAEVSVANGAASINSGNITDMRTRTGLGTNGITPNAVSQSSSVITFTDSASDDGSTVTGVSSDGWKDVTNLTRTITTTGGDVVVGFTIPMDCTSSAGTTLVRILDGATAKAKISVSPSATGQRHVVSFTALLSGLSAASHTIKVQFQMLAGGGATARFFYGQSTMYVQEIKR